jgi:hypothetical protein
MNIDGNIDFGDINPFSLALSDPGEYQNQYQILAVIPGDINQDGIFDFEDINPFVLLLTKQSNPPPEKPPIRQNIPSGLTRIFIGKLYNYTSFSFDLNGDHIFYNFLWGDGTSTGWIGPFESGQQVRATHQWNTNGVYQVQVKAKDTTGLESNWSDSLQVHVYTLGDVNNDGAVNFGDITPFIFALNHNQQQYNESYPNGYYFTADCNLDGVVNFGDINPFVALLSSGEK